MNDLLFAAANFLLHGVGVIEGGLLGLDGVGGVVVGGAGLTRGQVGHLVGRIVTWLGVALRGLCACRHVPWWTIGWLIKKNRLDGYPLERLVSV